MKLDLSYLRELLIEAEESQDIYFDAVLSIGASQEDQRRHYHAEQLCDAGFAERVNDGLYRVTFQGHDYLAAVRDEGVWKQTKDVVAKSGGNAVLELVKELAVGFVKKKIQDQTGIVL